MPTKSEFADQGARLEAVLKLSSAVMVTLEWTLGGPFSVLSVDGDTETVLGVHAAQIGAVGLPGLMYDEDRVATEELLAEVRNGKNANAEVRVVQPDGGIRWVRMEFEPIMGGKDCVRSRGMISDITREKLAEIREDDQRSLIKALSATTSVINSMLSLEEALQRILEKISPFIPFELIEIVLLGENGQPERRIFKHVFGGDLLLEKVNTTGLIQLLDKHGKIESKKSFWIPDTQSQEYSGLIPYASGIRSMLGTPIIANGGVLGYLNAYAMSPNIYNADHAAWINLFGKQAAIVIQKTSLVDEARRSAAESDTLRESITAVVSPHSRKVVLERILEQLALVVPYDTASAGYLVQDGFKIVCERGFYEDDEIIGMTFPVSTNNPSSEVYDTHEAIIIPDLREVYDRYPHFKEPPHNRILSWMGVPLIFKNSFVGILTLDSKTPNHFNERHGRLTQVYADQVAVALENARMFDEARRQAVESETLRQAIAAVASTINFDEIIDKILEQIQRVISYHTASVLLREGDEMVVSGSSSSASERARGMRFSLMANTPDAVMFRSRMPLIIPKLHEDNRYEGDEKLTRDMQSLLLVPLILDGEVIGEVVMISDVEDYFTQEHANLMMTFAGQVVVAIKNARLYDSLQEELRQRKVMEEELRRLATTDPLTGCLNRRHFGKLAALEYQRSLRYGRQLSLAMLDIDHFKRVNDVYGHAAGDEVLKSFVDTCQQNIRKNDLLARMGGEEFVLLFPETDDHEALHLLERLQRQVENSVIIFEGEEINITVSIGIAGLDFVGDKDMDFLMNCADKALYSSKSDGRNRTTIWSGSI